MSDYYDNGRIERPKYSQKPRFTPGLFCFLTVCANRLQCSLFENLPIDNHLEFWYTEFSSELENKSPQGQTGEAKMITTNQKITFNSQFVKGNGTWQVMKIWNDGQVWLAKLGKKGQMLTPNQDNQMNVPMAIITESLNIGTATLPRHQPS